MSPFNKLLFASVAAMAAAHAHAGELVIEVQGLASDQGQVMVAAFASAADWLKKPVAVAAMPAAGGSVVLRLKDLPEGATTIALSLYQDLNGNGRLDTNAMGMPQEPFGFSRDAVGNFGPPKFEQAALQLPVAGGRVVVKLN